MHEAPLPEGFNSSVFIDNLEPSPGQSSQSSDLGSSEPLPHPPAIRAYVIESVIFNNSEMKKINISRFFYLLWWNFRDCGGDARFESPEPAPAPAPWLGPLADLTNLPKTYYRAKNLGVTHETELIGFADPVVIENLQAAESNPAAGSAPCADESSAFPPPPPPQPLPAELPPPPAPQPFEPAPSAWVLLQYQNSIL